MSETEDEYPCVGICTIDSESGYCLGCGRPPSAVRLNTPGVIAETTHENARSLYALPEQKPLAEN